MSFFKKVKDAAKAALTPTPVETGTPDYATPSAYDIRPDKGWMLLHQAAPSLQLTPANA